MPKLGMGPIRRRQLIDAAIASIHEYGLADTTVARIARKAGAARTRFMMPSLRQAMKRAIPSPKITMAASKKASARWK